MDFKDQNRKFGVIAGQQQKIADKLDIEDVEPLIVTVPECTYSDDTMDDMVEDYKFIRDKLRYVICAGNAILDESLKEIRTDVSPRRVEGCSILLKTIVESSKELLGVHEKLQKIENSIPSKEPSGTDSGSEGGGVSGKLSDILEGMDELESESNGDD